MTRNLFLFDGQVIEAFAVQDQTTLWLESAAENCITWVNNLVGAIVPFLENLPEYVGRFNEALFIYSFLLFESLSSFIAAGFSDFQIKLLQVFLVILATHIIAIIITWNIYGQKIYERFYKQGKCFSCVFVFSFKYNIWNISGGLSHLNEQLKSGASELKLPKDHTPRW